MMFDSSTGFPLGDPNKALINEGFRYDSVSLKKAVSSMILSASGWRKVFAHDGDEESVSEEITSHDRLLVLIMAEVWTSFIRKKTGKKKPVLLVGTDSRPTGPAMAETMIRLFLAEGIEVKYSFITAAPEIMAAAKVLRETDGFAYISASHNPIGHNGVKFGMADGGVIGGEDAVELIEEYKKTLSDPVKINSSLEKLQKVPPEKIRAVFNQVGKTKMRTASAYASFARRVISGVSDPNDQDDFFNDIKKKSSGRGMGIVGELNGSARTLTIDKEIIESSGVLWMGINDKPRQITHRIVPEGLSLDLCRSELEKAHKDDKRFILGFVPDNDGDRGNIVYYNEKSRMAEILQAQEVFALSVLGELSWLEFLRKRYPDNEELKKPGAVAVNGPTSLRIESIAESLGASVLRAETGEANVVNRARLGRNDGYTVPILGEGSNGGNITHPAAVRDPLNTIYAIMKLLLYPDLFRSWCAVSDQPELFHEDYSLTDIINTLPPFTTTSAFEERALMKIRTESHAVLKKRYEDNFPSEWERKRAELKENFGITGFREINYEGTEAREGSGPEFRSGAEKGGLKIEFLNEESEPAGFIWMRGSGTEPVFRVMADLAGRNTEGEASLLQWHRDMIEKADLK